MSNNGPTTISNVQTINNVYRESKEETKDQEKKNKKKNSFQTQLNEITSYLVKNKNEINILAIHNIEIRKLVRGLTNNNINLGDYDVRKTARKLISNWQSVYKAINRNGTGVMDVECDDNGYGNNYIENIKIEDNYNNNNNNNNNKNDVSMIKKNDDTPTSFNSFVCEHYYAERYAQYSGCNVTVIKKKYDNCILDVMNVEIWIEPYTKQKRLELSYNGSKRPYLKSHHFKHTSNNDDGSVTITIKDHKKVAKLQILFDMDGDRDHFLHSIN